VAGVGVVAGDAERELDHVQPADVDRPRRIEPRQHRRGRQRPMVAEQGRAVLAQLPGPVKHVLVRERHAAERAQVLAARPRLVGRRGRGQSALRVEPRHRAELSAAGLQRPDRGFRRLARRHLARPDAAR
jgi:hypothetical protein